MSDIIVEKAKEIAERIFLANVSLAGDKPRGWSGKTLEHDIASAIVEAHASRDPEVASYLEHLHEAKLETDRYKAELSAEREATQKLVDPTYFLVGWILCSTLFIDKAVPSHLRPWKLVERVREALKHFTPRISSTPGHSPEGKTL